MPNKKLSKREREYLSEWDRKLAEQEIKYARKIKKEINRAIEAAKDEIDNYSTVEPILKYEHQTKLAEISLISAKSTTQTFIAFESKFLNYTVSDFFYETVYNQFASSQVLELSKLKADTTFKQIQEKIADQLINRSISERDIAKEILKLKKLTPARALMIARTEVHNTATFAQHEVAMQLESNMGETLYKKWIPTFDKRTRKDHAVMSRHPAIPLNQLFSVGGTQMNRPGDPRGGANQVINCRCVAIYAKLEDI